MSGVAVLRIATAVVVVIVAVLVVAWAMQRRLIYFPDPGPVPAAATVLPGGEDVSFPTADGLRLSGWFVPGGGEATVIVFNGNGGDRAGRAPLAAELGRTGMSVLLFDYRGYGSNPGHPTETGLAADARAARDYVRSRADVRAGSIVYFGESLGAAVAVALAAEDPPSALILRSPFTSLADVGRHHYPYLPVRALLKDRYDSIGRIGSLRCPLLVVAGSGDTVVPAEQSRRLFEAAPEPKRYAEVSGADHDDPELFAGDRLLREVVPFVGDALR